MNVLKATNIHVNQIAQLHIQGIPTGFISSLNHRIVERLYKTIVLNEIIYVVSEGDKVIGFVSCAMNTGMLYKKFIKSNFFCILPYFVLKIFRLSFLKKIFETIKAPNKTKTEKQTVDVPELLSIVIDSKQQAKGLGKLLLDALERDLRRKNISEYKVVAGTNLVSANRFYEKYNFKLLKQIQLHKGQISNVYTKQTISLSGDK